MINFCQYPFLSTTSATLIHQDGYEVDNLFSLDLEKRQRGYKIERFVRPPLSINIHFMIPVNVYYIVIWITLHEETEKCKIEFFTSGGRAGTDVVSMQSEKFCGSFFLSLPRALSVFHNPITGSVPHLDRCIPNKVLGSQVCERLVCQQITSQPLKPINELTTTTNLTLCFKQFNGSKSLSVKCLEVWGLPSKHCTVDQLKCFEKAKEACLLQQQATLPSASTMLYNTEGCRSNRFPASTSTSVDCIKQQSPVKNIDLCMQDNKDESTNVPEKFLDQLTYEIMILPYQLPSGYYVDQTTIEKCKEADLLYGRSPCDPFTGIPYTNASQPMFCAHLKSEIDMFVSSKKGRNVMPKTRQTAGTAEEIAKHRSLIGKLCMTC